MKQLVFKSLDGLRSSLAAVTVLQLSLGGFFRHLRAEGRGLGEKPLVGGHRHINADGAPGKHFSKAAQFQAVAPLPHRVFHQLEPAREGSLPNPAAANPEFFAQPGRLDHRFCHRAASFSPPSTPTSFLAAFEPSLETADLGLRTTGASGQNNTFGLTPFPDFDNRVANYNNLPNGPFPLEGPNLPYDSYTGDTTHRLFETWQQSDCSIQNVTPKDPSGCLNDLYPFLITNRTNQIDPSDTPPAIDDNGGGNSMGSTTCKRATSRS